MRDLYSTKLWKCPVCSKLIGSQYLIKHTHHCFTHLTNSKAQALKDQQWRDATAEEEDFAANEAEEWEIKRPDRKSVV